MTSASTFSEQDQTGDSTQTIDEEVSITTGPPQIERNNLSPQYQASNSASSSAPSSAIRLHGHAPAGDQVRVFIAQSALQQIDEHAHGDLEREVGGVLMGHLREGEAQLTIEILAALPAVSADHGPVHFTFTADAWARIHEDRSDQYPDLQIVGWFHTHPDLGVFYSADDVVVHTAAFVMPWHVGLVIDPVRLEGCLFGWRSVPNDMTKPMLTPINGYYERLDERPTSEATWTLVRSTIWQDSYLPEIDGEHSPNDLYMPDNDWPALPQISPWWGVLLGGTSLIITLLLLLERILSSAGN
jgi:proteasome lid subunit RPN8/RPN11